MESNENNSPCNYLVTLIDILGQKESLEGHRSLTETPEGISSLKTEGGQDEFRKIQEETFGKVIGLRESFENALNIYSKGLLENPGYKTLSVDDQRTIEYMSKPMSYQFFSDTIIIYTPLTSENELNMRYRIFTTIVACMNIMLMGFANGTFLRGGMEIGVGIEFPENNGIYGLALNDAYYLENKIAEYPRIVVGDKLVKLIQCKERKTKYSKFCKDINDSLDTFCNSSITKDKDSNYIVDFLCKTHADLAIATSLEQSRDYVVRGLEHISKQYTEHLANKNEKLSSRYELLKDYYFERLDNWGLQQITIE